MIKLCKVTRQFLVNIKLALLSKLKYLLLILSFFLYPDCAFPQNNSQSESEGYYVYYGYVYDTNGYSIDGVNIFQFLNGDTSLAAFTNEYGFFRIQTTQILDGLKFYIIGFLSHNIEFDHKFIIGSQIDVVLKQKSYSLPEITVTLDKPQKVLNRNDIWIYDYLVDEDGILLLGKNRMHNFLTRISLLGDTISNINHPYRSERLWQDRLRNQYIMTKDSMIQVFELKDTLVLLKGIDNKEFDKKIKPIEGVNDSVVIIKNAAKFNPEYTFTLFNRNSKDYKLLKKIVDRDQISIILDFVKGQQSLQNKHDISDSLTLYSYRDGFKDNMIFYHLFAQPIYSPFFKVDSGFVLFDLINDSIYKFDYSGKLVSNIPIAFHRSKFFRKILHDEATGIFYAKFIIRGVVSLSKIDIYRGLELGLQEIKVDFLYPEKISVYNGNAYFLYRRRYSSFSDRKTLYKIPIEL